MKGCKLRTGSAQALWGHSQEGEPSASLWRYKTYAYGPTAAPAQHAAASDASKLSELRTAVSEQSVLGTVVLRLSRNLFEASTGGHEWGAGFCLAELLLSQPQLVQGPESDHFARNWAATCSGTHVQQLWRRGAQKCTKPGRAQANPFWSLDAAPDCLASYWRA